MATLITEHVHEVTSVDLTIYKTHPPTLAIYAEGIAPTPGYTNPRLEPYVYIHPPTDGIWDFAFVADKPGGIVPTVLCPISTTYYWHNYPKDLKGVRVHASQNSVEAKLNERTATATLGTK